LIAALSESSEARLRLSLIPLFLEHPEFASFVQDVANSVTPYARLTLQCYYSAAVWLERKYRVREPLLEDYFSEELSLAPDQDPDGNLRALARRHQELSGTRVNWLGTYQHAAKVWFRALEFEHG
jgi:hypothetical protein